MTNKIDHQHVQDMTIEMDGGSFVGTKFERCILIYRGGAIPNISGAFFVNTEWRFDGAATNSFIMWGLIDFLQPQSAEDILEKAREYRRSNFSTIRRQ